jgi:general secretion pathway protein H
MRAGFTLVEMLVVLAILALVLAVVPPLLAGGQARAELDAATRELAAALRETRSQAIREGRSESFVVDAARHFRAGGGPAHALAHGLGLAFATADGHAVPAGAIRFFADGSSTGGRLILLSGERRSYVTVDWLTGRVALDPAGR